MTIVLQSAVLLAALLPSAPAEAQQGCDKGWSVEGSVIDLSGSAIAGATVQAAALGEPAITDRSGHYRLSCVSGATVVLTATAPGFAEGKSTRMAHGQQAEHVDFKLRLEDVQTSIEVSDASPDTAGDRGAGSLTLNTNEVQQLADDPDDLLRQLQALSASAGGSPASAHIMIDGFQSGSALPPKSSIASIRVNPDLFSAEYRFPPFEGGLIEVVTRPGAERFHGALFGAESSRGFNATAPLSATVSPARRSRYGFEWSGPIVPRKSGFALALEKRDIDEFNVVNATTLAADGAATPARQTVAAPQRLWIASARGDCQISPNDRAALSFSSRVDQQKNQGVGGLTLAEAGYSSQVSEHALRLSNTLIANASRLHETHIGYTWKRSQQTALSMAPSLQVAGSFIGGGATGQNQDDRERDLQVDEDVLMTRGRQELKFGVQSLGIFDRRYDPDNFNGAYVFGGGSAPMLDSSNQPTTQSTTISALEQYRRARKNLAGGTPTTYQLTRGTPLVPLTQWQLNLYAQDTLKLTPSFTANLGLRYALQTAPTSVANFGPRIGFSWSPDQKQTWIVHARFGLFTGVINPGDAMEAKRLDPSHQQKLTVYAPSYLNPLTPTAGSIEVTNTQQFPSSLAQHASFAGYLNLEHELAHHWTLRMNLFFGDDWNVIRTRNINAPMVASAIGVSADPVAALGAPRPFAVNENRLQYQNAGHLSGKVLSFVVDQHSYKRFGLFSYYAHRIAKSDGGNGNVMPQSSYSDAGESAQADWARADSVFLTGNLNLPYGIVLSTQFDAQAGTPFNITTGTDNNGDGAFNDRPSYASASGPGVYNTRYGVLTANTVNGNVPRNLGRMPPVIHLDANLSRVFSLRPKDKDHSRSVDLHIRSANLLNHTNVTSVGTVLSPSLGQPLSAETSRRVELGVRFAF